MNEKLFELLKTKAAPLGFSETELKAVAEALGKSLNTTEGAEQNEETLLGLINQVMPSLELSQKAANRIVAKKQKEFDEKLQQALQTTNPPKASVPPTNTPAATEDKGTDEFAKLTQMMQKFMEDTNKRFDLLDGQRLSQTRKQQLEAVVKDSGIFGKRAIKAFERMKFESDDDFNEWLGETKSDLEAYNKEIAAQGLPGKPFGGKADETNKKEVITDAQIDELANAF
jgi:cytochrome c556